jgi:hypothetical protein
MQTAWWRLETKDDQRTVERRMRWWIVGRLEPRRTSDEPLSRRRRTIGYF